MPHVLLAVSLIAGLALHSVAADTVTPTVSRRAVKLLDKRSSAETTYPTTSVTTISYWRPAGQFIINPDELANKAGFVYSYLTGAFMWGSAKLSAEATAPVSLGDIAVYATFGTMTYMWEALAVVDEEGNPQEMLDMLECSFTDPSSAPCTLYDWNGSSVQDKRTDLAATISSVIATYVGSDQAGAWANFVDTAVGANEKRSLRDGREKLHGRKVQQHQDETLAKRARNAPTADLPRRTAAPARMS